MRETLIGQLGGENKLTPPQRAVVERAAMLQLKCAMLDKKILDGTFSEHDTRTYLAFANALGRTLSRLGVVQKPAATTASQQSAWDALRRHIASRDAAA